MFPMDGRKKRHSDVYAQLVDIKEIIYSEQLIINIYLVIQYCILKHDKIQKQFSFDPRGFQNMSKLFGND